MKVFFSFLVLPFVIFSYTFFFQAKSKTNSYKETKYEVKNVSPSLKKVAPLTQLNKKIIAIDIRAGKYYEQPHKFGLIQINVIPQIAIWLEDKNGNYVETIYVSQKSGKSNWIGGKEIRRPSALPIWSHKKGTSYSDGLFMPDKKNPLPDAITGATPKKSFAKIWNVPSYISDGEYFLNVEINSSFDYNEFYKENLSLNDFFYNDVSGQPSLLWRGKIKVGNNENLSELKLEGHGNPIGKNGDVSSDLSKITTALQIVDSIRAKFEIK